MGKKLEIVDQVFTGEAASFSLERKKYIVLKEFMSYKIGYIIYGYIELGDEPYESLIKYGYVVEYNAEYISKFRDDKINDILK